MTADVSRFQGAYKIQSPTGQDILVVDTTGTTYLHPPKTSSKVVITGDLYILGTRTESSSTFISATDPTLLLNKGNTWGGDLSNKLAGIQISRSADDNLIDSAFIQWNEDATWQGTGQLGTVPGVFELRRGSGSGNVQYSAIRVNKILIDEASASTVGANRPRLNLLGADNPNSVLSVSGVPDYWIKVRDGDKDDIPNKEYVDNAVATQTSSTLHIVDGKSYVTIIDQFRDGAPSQIVGVLNGAPVETSGIISGNLSSGTLVMSISASGARFTGIQLVGNQVRPTNTNTNLILDANGTGQIIVAAPLIFETSAVPVPGAGQTGLYSDDSAGGGTGIYFVNSSTGGVVTSDEFVSRKKALVFSLIF
jgi:hypothetical protein